MAKLTPEQQDRVRSQMDLPEAVARSVWRKAPHALDLDELTSVAFEHLCLAAQRYDAYCRENGYDTNAGYFGAFAARRLRGALLDFIRTQDYSNRSTRDKSKRLREAGQDEGVSDQELSRRTGMSLDEVRKTNASLAARPVALEELELHPPAPTSVEQTLQDLSFAQVCSSVLRRLPPDQATVLAMHYYQGMELKQVATALGIAESRASSLHTQAVMAMHSAAQQLLAS